MRSNGCGNGPSLKFPDLIKPIHEARHQECVARLYPGPVDVFVIQHLTIPPKHGIYTKSWSTIANEECAGRFSRFCYRQCQALSIIRDTSLLLEVAATQINQ
jgi:hypothetical protein